MLNIFGNILYQEQLQDVSISLPIVTGAWLQLNWYTIIIIYICDRLWEKGTQL